MENVWDHLRQNKLCAQVWNTYDNIVEACQKAWRFLVNDPERYPLNRLSQMGVGQPLGWLV
jgi:hypothetical protein